jgi:DNA invertase Pin-like site-specific DNA recombinase
MSGESKVSGDHLRRKACVYVRQSTLVQVQEHQESTQRQYDLHRRAQELGWQAEQIMVIDEDLGQSASDVNRVRAGYQHLLSVVVSGQIGAVLSVEVSRLARQDSEGHKLVEIAALMETLLVDESQVYDPRLADDRLMLGLKVLLSSNEIRLMRQRLQENKVRKAQRGELRLGLPVGLVNKVGGGLALDPNEAVQGAVRLVFERFRLTGRVSEVVRYFHKNGQLFPRHRGNWDGPIEWGRLSIQRAHYILTNPLYAGAYVYGRTERKASADADGRLVRKLQDRPPQAWLAIQWEAFAGYIGRTEYEANQRQLAPIRKRNHRRDGSALLSQMLVCGRCGKRMYVCYNGDGGCYNTYVCTTRQMRYAETACQRMPAPAVDRAVTQRLLEALSPAQMELSLAALDELERQQVELHGQWLRRLEGVRYAAHLAQRRYEQVEPENRLVVRQLEHNWEQQLHEVANLEADYSRFCQGHPHHLNADQRQRLIKLAQDFPRLWQAETTTPAERKALVELLIADVTLTRGPKHIQAQIRWHTNQVETLELPLPVNGGAKTPAKIVERLSALYKDYTDQQIAVILNQEGIRTANGNSFTESIVACTRRRNHLRKA